jgi:hypothetical protein
MNNSFVRLVQGMNHTLRSEVLPRLDDEYARGQVWGLINLLNTFEKRADWSSGFLLQQLQAQGAALDEAQALLARPPQAHAEPPPPSAQVAELLARRDRNNQAISALLAELDGAISTDAALGAGGIGAQNGAVVSASGRAQALAVLRQAMRTEVELELAHSPRPLFAQMSGAAE